jgi:hypothetical protein
MKPPNTRQGDEYRAEALGLLFRIARALERLESSFDEAAGAYLNMRGPYGRAEDRWTRDRSRRR